MQRYASHVNLPEIGLKGQKLLQRARVAIVGCGGLGNHVALSLVCHGIGHLTLIDGDGVELSNLPRQMMFDFSDLGLNKAKMLARKLRQKSPEAEVIPLSFYIDQHTVGVLNERFDLIVDGTDQFRVKQLLNERAIQMNRPLISAGCQQWSGWVASFYSTGPCLTCLFPQQHTSHSTRSCSALGVVSFLPALLGHWQAACAIQILLGQDLIGKGFFLDALRNNFLPFNFECSSHCECHQNLASSKYLKNSKEHKMPISHSCLITVKEVNELLENGQQLHLLDVRTENERNVSHIGGVWIPLSELATRFHELDTDSEWIVYCRSGNRSQQAVDFLEDQGFKAKNLKGGMQAWRHEIDPHLVVA
ncbi:MAG: HesA/MoeB/ThiF family protein [Gammaproteobacteria bacterium]